MNKNKLNDTAPLASIDQMIQVENLLNDSIGGGNVHAQRRASIMGMLAATLDNKENQNLIVPSLNRMLGVYPSLNAEELKEVLTERLVPTEQTRIANTFEYSDDPAINSVFKLALNSEKFLYAFDVNGKAKGEVFGLTAEESLAKDQRILKYFSSQYLEAVSTGGYQRSGFDSLSDAYKNDSVLKQAGDAGARAYALIKGTMKSVVNQVKEKAETLNQLAHDFVTNSKAKVQSDFLSAKQGIAVMNGIVVDRAAQDIEKTRERASRAYDKVSGKMTASRDRVFGVAQRFSQSIGDSWSRLSGKLAEKAELNKASANLKEGSRYFISMITDTHLANDFKPSAADGLNSIEPSKHSLQNVKRGLILALSSALPSPDTKKVADLSRSNPFDIAVKEMAYLANGVLRNERIALTEAEVTGLGHISSLQSTREGIYTSFRAGELTATEFSKQVGLNNDLIHDVLMQRGDMSAQAGNYKNPVLRSLVSEAMANTSYGAVTSKAGLEESVEMVALNARSIRTPDESQSNGAFHNAMRLLQKNITQEAASISSYLTAGLTDKIPSALNLILNSSQNKKMASSYDLMLNHLRLMDKEDRKNIAGVLQDGGFPVGILVDENFEPVKKSIEFKSQVFGRLLNDARKNQNGAAKVILNALHDSKNEVNDMLAANRFIHLLGGKTIEEQAMASVQTPAERSAAARENAPINSPINALRLVPDIKPAPSASPVSGAEANRRGPYL